MNIILQNQLTEEIQEKYILLELDTFQFTSDSKPVKSFCVIENAHVQLPDYPQLDNIQDLHRNMIKNYQIKNWKFVEDALEHLVGKFKGEVDSFYHVINERIKKYKIDDEDDISKYNPPDDWTYVIKKF
ncbi:uncharacterized protein METZ01_LOCUS358602 [marine metagenome]|uniref:Uncharacterized protein n=1 Tax=marine metagenome TaxID=408172 RepID=A0A382S9C6_9ZZZZ